MACGLWPDHVRKLWPAGDVICVSPEEKNLLYDLNKFDCTKEWTTHACVCHGAGATALMAAAGKGRLHEVALLLAAGADAAIQSKGGTAREWALKFGHAEAAQMLQEHEEAIREADAAAAGAVALSHYQVCSQTKQVFTCRLRSFFMHYSSKLWSTAHAAISADHADGAACMSTAAQQKQTMHKIRCTAAALYTLRPSCMVASTMVTSWDCHLKQAAFQA